MPDQDLLRRFDPSLVVLEGGPGSVFVSPGLQGRIFADFGGELIHRLDQELLEHPLAGEFNNLGGNSLWPAPEGGPFAFNYLPDSEEWVVQPGIADQPAQVVSLDAQRAAIEKTIELTNRRGTALKLRYAREVERCDPPGAPAGADIAAVAYRSADTFEPLGEYSSEDALLAPWSLEQFPGGSGVTAFARVDRPETAINFDFYGMPDSPPSCGDGFFALALGGTARFQIGVKTDHHPRLLGALDRSRGLLLLRTTEPQNGRYFNIADNDQPEGPWSAADLYSVFGGGELDFFELETIAPMQTRNGRLAASALT